MKKTSPYFKILVEHINDKWKAKKGFSYPFHGKDFRYLKNYENSFQAWGLMSLFDVFMSSENDWVKKSGYSLNAFYSCLPWLVDDPGWKGRAREYENEIAPLPKEIADIIKTR